jgi:hypothetical protein
MSSEARVRAPAPRREDIGAPELVADRAVALDVEAFGLLSIVTLPVHSRLESRNSLDRLARGPCEQYEGVEAPTTGERLGILRHFLRSRCNLPAGEP